MYATSVCVLDGATCCGGAIVGYRARGQHRLGDGRIGPGPHWATKLGRDGTGKSLAAGSARRPHSGRQVGQRSGRLFHASGACASRPTIRAANTAPNEQPAGWRQPPHQTPSHPHRGVPPCRAGAPGGVPLACHTESGPAPCRPRTKVLHARGSGARFLEPPASLFRPQVFCAHPVPLPTTSFFLFFLSSH